MQARIGPRPGTVVIRRDNMGGPGVDHVLSKHEAQILRDELNVAIEMAIEDECRAIELDSHEPEGAK